MGNIDKEDTHFNVVAIKNDKTRLYLGGFNSRSKAREARARYELGLPIVDLEKGISHKIYRCVEDKEMTKVYP